MLSVCYRSFEIVIVRVLIYVYLSVYLFVFLCLSFKTSAVDVLTVSNDRLIKGIYKEAHTHTLTYTHTHIHTRAMIAGLREHCWLLVGWFVFVNSFFRLFTSTNRLTSLLARCSMARHDVVHCAVLCGGR